MGLAVGQDEESEQSRIDASAFDTLKRPAALFDHDTHNEAAGVEDCEVCHHVWENGKIVEGESSEDSPCSECHSLKATPENKMALANAYHTQCRTCHIDKGKGPLLCGECHKKE
ncbi:MAG: cytochrome c3 family protein [Desulfobacter sp.]|nr:MAG: cytochrome c3 family protein [Desulfobacter sp.]